MKIASSLNVPAAGSGAATDRPAGSKPAAEGAPAVTGASVRLSDLSAQLTASVQGTDFDHVTKQAIAEGKLTVNAGAVADRLIANALALSNDTTK